MSVHCWDSRRSSSGPRARSFMPMALWRSTTSTSGSKAALAASKPSVSQVSSIDLTISTLSSGTLRRVFRLAAAGARLLRTEQAGADPAHPHPLRVVAYLDARDLGALPVGDHGHRVVTAEGHEAVAAALRVRGPVRLVAVRGDPVGEGRPVHDRGVVRHRPRHT